ncbi:Rab11c [Monocercomonoides exilis]|uniref:Rab11c n=1 Tax=Monocercomonoides exilis TaxID=2049356 RepID=UPI00355A79C4|nr:Rab11c [Monocercomonoides exilis]|eukprot:MONOS_12092.1-p1 / transcript=MONOS_12092.1 / gene=MONOS_12092 / organism=Monocercomonoides_exilis_PA203 / gene_product=Rab11c / transcript_product=Rab11c / location=Mono_scaffold00644:32658-34026(-) / protein_length=338 / sequence_SO=supercontig / SO=protein_coding / is_pseudo=false
MTFEYKVKSLQAWTPIDVKMWICSIGLGDHAQQFRRSTGEILLALTETAFKERFGADIEAGQIGWSKFQELKARQKYMPSNISPNPSPDRLLSPSSNSSSSPSDFVYKVVVVGDSDVGKTNLLNRFVDNTFFWSTRPTIGVEFRTKHLRIGDVTVTLQLWDTAGQERFRALSSAYYRGAVGAVAVYDVTNPNTLTSLSDVWLKEIRVHCAPSCVGVIVGNKKDLGHLRLVKEEEGRKIAEMKESCAWIETSALDGTNVSEMFVELAKAILMMSSSSFASSLLTQSRFAQMVLNKQKQISEDEDSNEGESESGSEAEVSASVGITESDSENSNRKCDC